MRVKCVANVGERLSQKTLDAGYKKDSKFNIEIGTEYTVYSMIMWKETLDYLISTSPEAPPSWYPAELFEEVNFLLPLIWYFSFNKYKNYKGEDSQVAIWGYKEIATDPKYYIALAEEKTEALNIFFKRKCQMDEFEETNQFRP